MDRRRRGRSWPGRGGSGAGCRARGRTRRGASVWFFLGGGNEVEDFERERVEEVEEEVEEEAKLSSASHRRVCAFSFPSLFRASMALFFVIESVETGRWSCLVPLAVREREEKSRVQRDEGRGTRCFFLRRQCLLERQKAIERRRKMLYSERTSSSTPSGSVITKVVTFILKLSIQRDLKGWKGIREIERGENKFISISEGGAPLV